MGMEAFCSDRFSDRLCIPYKETNEMKELEVVAGVIFHEGKVLCMQRAKSKYEYVSLKFEFPGGKIESAENPVDALKRELLEEIPGKDDHGCQRHGAETCHVSISHASTSHVSISHASTSQHLNGPTKDVGGIPCV
jgi:hypothetical protein